MTTTSVKLGDPKGSPFTIGTITGVLLRYLGLMVVDALALFLVYQLTFDGFWTLALTIAVITIGVNIINLREDLYPLRWISPALALMTLLVIFPIFYTVYIAFTNYGTGNVLTKPQALDRYAQILFLPEGGEAYNWIPFQSADTEEYALWLTDANGNAYFSKIGEDLASVTTNESGEGPFDDAGIPISLDGYTRLDGADRGRALLTIQSVQFGTEDSPIGIKSRSSAGAFQQRYTYDEDRDVITDQETGTLYLPDYETGQFRSEIDPEATLITGFWVTIGWDNFARFFNSPAFRGPLLRIFTWTVTFALFSVLSTFAVGLLFALLFQAGVPAKKVFQTLLIVPYAIPGVISIAIWRGMLNENFGILTGMMDSVFGAHPPFFTDPTWAKFAILLINLWLGYPYFMLVCSGALAAIPSDMYEAARVDGANAWQQFKGLTLPMLLISVGPLLIASFTFNFNNFVIVEVFNEGGPPIANAGGLPAGHTDLLISYAFRLAFGTGRGQDFGLASAITIIIFLMVAGITLIQFRLTKTWEEQAENV